MGNRQQVETTVNSTYFKPKHDSGYIKENNLNIGKEFVKSTDNMQGGIILNQNLNQRKYIGRITTNELIAAFNSNAIDNFYLNKDKFNEAIRILLHKISLPTIAFTHLTDKLYDMIDVSGDGRISCDEFVNGMAGVLGNEENCKKRKFLLF